MAATTAPALFIGSCSDCKIDGLPHVVTAEGRTSALHTCGLPVYLTEIRARVGRRECDTHCTEGTGRSCTCTCGGLNHGLAWRVR